MNLVTDTDTDTPNYAKFCFDAKHLENGLNRGDEIFGALLSKKPPLFIKSVFLANVERCPKFLEYAL